MAEREQENEIVLFPGEYCYYMDRTSGDVSVVVGPQNQKLSQTDKLVQWSEREKRFIPVSFQDAKQKFITIPEGWYAPLKNPASDVEHPAIGAGSSQNKAGLRVGKKVNIAGPDHFALWPGQMAKVIEGHKLRSNQYLLVRVYDVEAFKAEIAHAQQTAVVETGADDAAVETDEVNRARETSVYDGLDETNLATGQQFIIKGTHVHFYIPPNGIEVVPFSDSNGYAGYVHNAVTLEQLQYCILQDEDGKKRYVRGPAVVFPEPTEKFLSAKNKSGMDAKKFMAVELNETSGIYIEVIKAYEENGKTYNEGDEMFVTGKEQKIYFPREEHAVIRYGDQDRHYAVALPTGEGRYVLDRINGGVSTEMGPSMFLPDPRSQVIVNRILSERESNLLFPGNIEVMEHNEAMRETSRKKRRNIEYRTKGTRSALLGSVAYAGSMDDGYFSQELSLDEAPKGVMGDAIDRGGQYVAPRSITLKNKFDGVVAFDVWNGYAVLVSNRNGERRVIEGPQRVHLEYDESPEAVQLSTGTPKQHERTIETAFLRTRHNVVSEMITVETKDLCSADIRVSMRVDFKAETEEDRFKWFSVDNYIKLLCERVNSLLKNHVRQLDVMGFYNDSTNIIRDIILGKSTEEGRPGLVFEDNGMVVSEVEVLSVKLEDRDLAIHLKRSASDALSKAITLAEAKRNLAHNQETAKITEEGSKIKHALEMVNIDNENALKAAVLASKADEAELKKVAAEAEVEARKVNTDAEILEYQARKYAEVHAAEALVKVKAMELEAEAGKVSKIMDAVQPDLVAALSSLGDNDRIEKIARAVAPQNVFGDEGLLELMRSNFEGLGMKALWTRLGVSNESGKLLPATESPKKKTTKKS